MKSGERETRTSPAGFAAAGSEEDIHPRADTASEDLELLRSPEHILLSVPEAASLLRVGERTVWRLMADPRSGFPEPRRIRGRTLLLRDELLAFVEAEASR